MKKIILTVATIFAIGAVNAQEKSDYKPTKGTVTTEVGLTGGLNNADFNLDSNLLKFRYFLKDDLGLRLGFGVNNEKDEFSAGVSPNKVTTITKNNSLDIKLGVEKHFAGSDRLSTYGGADIVFGSGKDIIDISEENGDFNKSETPTSRFGFNLFTGADYYIAKKLFLGVEAGLSILSVKEKDTDISDKTGSVTTSTTTPGNTKNTLLTDVFGGIRIGYQF